MCQGACAIELSRVVERAITGGECTLQELCRDDAEDEIEQHAHKHDVCNLWDRPKQRGHDNLQSWIARHGAQRPQCTQTSQGPEGIIGRKGSCQSQGCRAHKCNHIDEFTPQRLQVRRRGRDVDKRYDDDDAVQNVPADTRQYAS